ncbi:hypothetical protein [Ramlibacter sp.]|uniref:hypothetical protein n=1 Tax=Ramlibacter sp. TaxID=1917967 RepID=UPI003D12DF32
MKRRYPVTLRLADAGEISLSLDERFASTALRWSYIARNRERWTGTADPGSRNGPLHDLLTPEMLERIAASGVVEVSFAFGRKESDDWPLRVFPWEYALASATSPWRDAPLVVVRHAAGGASSRGGVRLARPAVVECAAGARTREGGVSSEGELMLRSLGADASDAGARLRNPTLEQLRRWIAGRRPTVLHLAGMDNHAAAALGAPSHRDAAIHDGLALRGADAQAPQLVASDVLAAALCGDAGAPDLIVCNFYNSASRVASECVRRGARFAIGYHDTIPDEHAALLCATLYRLLADNGGDMLDAFSGALDALRCEPAPLHGACIVLWSGTALLRSRNAPRPRKPARARTALQAPPWQRIAVEARPLDNLNYSLLHNRQSPLQRLRIARADGQGEIRDIAVTVELQAGESTARYRRTLALPADRAFLDIDKEVVLPLTSALIRTPTERVQTSLRLHVACEGATVLEETYRVGLCPIDEWQDGARDEWRWLPSFVLPRDPAVARIVASAQGILRALADDPAAGFDGYQGVDANGDTDAQRYACVDRQVQALWYALLDVYRLDYINPPPSYGRRTQRLRTPSQLLAEGRGTCIDLALLLAACMEAIDIHPVIFLLQGHAFAGYWRSDALHEEFVQVRDVAFDAQAAPDADCERAEERGGSAGGLPRYVLENRHHVEVRQRVTQRKLLPLETTGLTCRGGFDIAAADGRGNLRIKSEFEAMIDLRLARQDGVTPLPMLQDATLAG